MKVLTCLTICRPIRHILLLDLVMQISRPFIQVLHLYLVPIFTDDHRMYRRTLVVMNIVYNGKALCGKKLFPI